MEYDIRSNLELAIELVENEPDQLVSLRNYEHKTLCGTLHCTLGLLALQPEFQDQGLWLLPSGFLLIDGESRNHLALDTRFGPDAYRRLFDMRGQGKLDRDVFDLSEMSDKDLALYRLRRQLKEITDVEAPR